MAKNTNQKDLREEIRSVTDVLSRCALPLLKWDQKIDPSELDAASMKGLAEAKDAVQVISNALGKLIGDESDTHAQKPQKRSKTVPKPQIGKKKNAKLTNFLILYAVFRQHSSNRSNRAISQDILFGLLCELDPTQEEKRGSFTARLSDIRRDKKWLEWDDPEDIQIGENGIEGLMDLYRTAQNNKDFQSARAILERHFKEPLDFKDIPSRPQTT